MKNIIYIIDSLSPLALKSLSKKFYKVKNSKFTHFDKLIKKSILIENIYGHGETCQLFLRINWKNIYKYNCDSWYLKIHLKNFQILVLILKKKATNIYLRNASQIIAMKVSMEDFQFCIKRL